MIEGRPPRDRSAQGATTTSPQARKAVQEDIVNYQIKLDAVEQTNVGLDELTEPLTFPVAAYLSPEYARAEGDRPWSKVWPDAGRVEEIRSEESRVGKECVRTCVYRWAQEN